MNIMKITTLLAVLLSISSVAQAASFDCTKASTQIENAICSDDKLSELDSQLLHAYKKALAECTNPVECKEQQKSWLVTVRNKCTDAACIEAAYTDRIAALSTTTTNTPPSTSNTGGTHAEAATFGFKQFKIGMEKSGVKNLGKCFEKGNGLEVCDFDPNVSLTHPQLNIFGLKSSIAGVDAIVWSLGFIKNKVVIINLKVPVQGVSYFEIEEKIRVALSSKYKVGESGRGNSGTIERRWYDPENNGLGILWTDGGEKVKTLSDFGSFLIQFTNFSAIEAWGQKQQASEQEKAEKESARRNNDL